MSFPSIEHTGHGPLSGAAAVLSRAFAPVKAGLSAAFTSIQVAQMASALSRMSDRQLADIGITRADIPSHAKNMIVPHGGDR